MLKQISSLGKTLNKAQQKEINGGFGDDQKLMVVLVMIHS